MTRPPFAALISRTILSLQCLSPNDQQYYGKEIPFIGHGSLGVFHVYRSDFAALPATLREGASLGKQVQNPPLAPP